MNINSTSSFGATPTCDYSSIQTMTFDVIVFQRAKHHPRFYEFLAFSVIKK